MLKLNSAHHVGLPHFDFDLPHLMQLSPVSVDNDELVQDIMNDQAAHDDNWELSNPDSQELEAFWSTVQNDIHSDPEWISLSDNQYTNIE